MSLTLKRYLSLIVVLVSALALVLPIIQWRGAEELLHNYPLAILSILASGLGAAFAAVYMQYVLRKQKLRRDARRVFMIYAKEDRNAAEAIAKLLRDNGFNPWLDTEQIEAGQIWKEVIDEALDEAAIALVLSSKHFASSITAKQELARAIKKMESASKYTSPVIPVKLDEAELPKSLSHVQYVELGTDDGQEFLLRSLEGASRRVMGSVPDLELTTQ
jgi:nucleotide-binding universal stress UspA family protein